MVNVLYLQEHTLCLFEFSKASNLQIAVFLIQCGNTFYWQPMLNPQRCGLIKSLQQNTLEQNGQNQFTNTFLFLPLLQFFNVVSVHLPSANVAYSVQTQEIGFQASSCYTQKFLQLSTRWGLWFYFAIEEGCLWVSGRYFYVNGSRTSHTCTHSHE